VLAWGRRSLVMGLADAQRSRGNLELRSRDELQLHDREGRST